MAEIDFASLFHSLDKADKIDFLSEVAEDMEEDGIFIAVNEGELRRLAETRLGYMSEAQFYGEQEAANE